MKNPSQIYSNDKATLMKKNAAMFMLIIACSLFLAGCQSRDSSANADKPAKSIEQAKPKPDYPVSSMETIADKVQVFLFHSTQRCTSCIAIGRLAGETVNERFQDEIKSDRIEFKEVNIDLPENKELAKKFQASGSALYLNAIRGDSDNIEQDTRVWQLTKNEQAFKDYLENKINILLGK
jgi:hypothetical protein